MLLRMVRWDKNELFETIDCLLVSRSLLPKLVDGLLGCVSQRPCQTRLLGATCQKLNLGLSELGLGQRVAIVERL